MIKLNEPMTAFDRDELVLVKQALQTHIDALDKEIDRTRNKSVPEEKVNFKLSEVQRLIELRDRYLKLIAQI